MQLPAELTLSERVALEVGPLAIAQPEAAPWFEWTTSNSIAVIAVVVSVCNVLYTIGSAIWRRRKDDLRYAFDASYASAIQSSLGRLDNAIDLVSQAATEPDAADRRRRISEYQRTLLNPWYFHLDGLLYESQYPSALEIVSDLEDFWDIVAVTLNSVSEPSFTHSSSDALYSLNRAAHRFRKAALQRTLENRKRL